MFTKHEDPHPSFHVSPGGCVPYAEFVALQLMVAALTLLASPGVSAGSCPNRHSVWVGSVGPSIAPRDLTLTRNGDVLMCGRFFSFVDFDPTEKVDERLGSSGDAFVLRVNSDGTYGWTHAVGGIEGDSATGVASLQNGDIIAVGVFNNIVDFDPGPGADERIATGESNSFVTRLSRDGQYLGTTTFGDGSDNADTGAAGVAVDRKENMYIVGNFDGNADFDPSAESDFHQASGTDIFLTKFSSDMSYEWTVTIGGTGFDVAHQIAVDDDDNVFIAGTFRNTVDFDFGSGVDNHTSIGVDNLFITKVLNNGSYGWTRTYPILQSSARPLATDSSGSVYMTGSFFDTVDFDRSNGVDLRSPMSDDADVYVTKVHSDGSYGWTWTVGGVRQDGGNGLAVDAEDNVYVTGEFMESVDFDHGPGVDVHTSLGGDDTFVTSLRADGSYLWTRTFGGVTRVAGKLIAVAHDRNVIVVGRFISFEGYEVDLDPSCEEVRLVDHLPGASDTYINKLICTKPSADHDRNGRVDLRDFAAFQNCITEIVHGGQPLPACGDGCASFDMDPTDTIDLYDYAKDAFIFTGP